MIDISDRKAQERGTAFFGMGCKAVRSTAILAAGRSYDVTFEYSVLPGSPIAGVIAGAGPEERDPEEQFAEAVAAARQADAVVVVVGTTGEWESEGADRTTMDLPGLQDELVRRVVAANPRTAVVVNAGSPVTMDWADDVPALAQVWFGGQQVGNAVADVLSGDAEPGGRLPTTIPVRLEDTPAFGSYPGTDGQEIYREGLAMGYRHYDAEGAPEPRYCFGHGLSYTTFELAGLSVAEGAGGHVAVASCTVTNTGDRPGTETVQCYVHDLDPAEAGPPKALRDFRKVELGPGESTTVAFELGERAFAHWDPAAGAFTVAPGRYQVLVGRSSRDLALAATIAVDAGRTTA